MYLEKVFISNFLSISNLQELKISNKITTLIGKNGSGKTSVLKAIEMLNRKNIPLEYKNISRQSDESIVKARFLLKKSYIKLLNENYKQKYGDTLLYLPENGDLHFYVEVRDKGNVVTYLKDLNGNKIDLYTNSIVEINKRYKQVTKSFENKELKNKIQGFLAISESAAGVLSRLSWGEINQLNDEIKTFLEKLSEEIINWSNFIYPSFTFIYMNTFKDILVDGISIDEIDNNKTVLSFLKIAGVSKEDIISAVDSDNQQSIINIVNKTVSVVTSDFKKIFTQVKKDDYFKISMTIDSKNRKLNFWIQNKITGDSVIPFSSESEGMQWYLSLYFKLYDYFDSDSNSNYILLIDEPNIYLHAEAQFDLLNSVFKNKLKNIQVIYTTHSPYMIDSEDLFSLRIIDKDNETKIYNNTMDYLKNANPDVGQVDILSPVLIATGINISNNLTISKKDKVIIVEGPHDYYVLSKMMNILELKSRYKIIPCQGANKVLIMTSYLYGFGYNVCAILDNDTEGRRVYKDFKYQNENLDSLHCILYFNCVNTNEDCLLEDLFSENDRLKYLPEKSTIYYRNIYVSDSSIQFDIETINNFKELFNRINDSFKIK